MIKIVQKIIILCLLSINTINSQDDQTIIFSGVGIKQTVNGIIDYDTVMVVMLVSDTSHRFEEIDSILSCEFVKCTDNTTLHSHFSRTKIDRGNYRTRLSYWMYGYSVREKRSSIDYREDNFLESGYSPNVYFINLGYLDIEKQKLSPNIIVWNSINL